MDTAQSLTPYYRDIVGHDTIISQLQHYVATRTVPHALLLAGDEMSEALPLAMAYARHLLCLSPLPSGESCGHCAACKQMDVLEDPDFCPVFPIIKEGERVVRSADVMPAFRQLLGDQLRPTYEDWKQRLSGGNKQPSIMVAEAEYLIEYASLKSFQSRYQVILLWMPELMRVETANKLLKLLEEPPSGVVFVAVSAHPGRLLPTIISRFQRISVGPIPEEQLQMALEERWELSTTEAQLCAAGARGSLRRAIELIHGTGVHTGIEDAIRLLQLPLRYDPRLYRDEVDALAKRSRPEIIDLIGELVLLLREVLIVKYDPDGRLSTLPPQYREMIAELAPHWSTTSIDEMLSDLQDAANELKQNANVKITFFDLLLHISLIYAR